MTPLQEKVQYLLDEYAQRTGKPISGRELSARLGKSRNHLSQIMNDGLIPSGEVLVKLAKVLEVGQQEQRRLMLAALHTKAQSRARDSFWLRFSIDLSDDLMAQNEQYEAFLETIGRLREFQEWSQTSPRGDRSEEADES